MVPALSFVDLREAKFWLYQPPKTRTTGRINGRQPIFWKKDVDQHIVDLSVEGLALSLMKECLQDITLRWISAADQAAGKEVLYIISGLFAS